ncbi:unnamed protein product [Paramecium sonneborni]|uniref:Uncharacterized protein n=1 Tax=Paramecium sonneborni TaxID=65129 RepID=A0A8S1KJV3_9CILI|nr:unnamed protein product [Paramecium sonneborni]
MRFQYQTAKDIFWLMQIIQLSYSETVVLQENTSGLNFKKKDKEKRRENIKELEVLKKYKEFQQV